MTLADWINRCHFGDCVETMRRMPDGIVQTCVTSPTKFRVRDYDRASELTHKYPRLAACDGIRSRVYKGRATTVHAALELPCSLTYVFFISHSTLLRDFLVFVIWRTHPSEMSIAHSVGVKNDYCGISRFFQPFSNSNKYCASSPATCIRLLCRLQDSQDVQEVAIDPLQIENKSRRGNLKHRQCPQSLLNHFNLLSRKFPGHRRFSDHRTFSVVYNKLRSLQDVINGQGSIRFHFPPELLSVAPSRRCLPCGNSTCSKNCKDRSNRLNPSRRIGSAHPRTYCWPTRKDGQCESPEQTNQGKHANHCRWCSKLFAHSRLLLKFRV